MVRRIKNKLKSGFVRAWLVILVLILAVVSFRLIFFSPHSPSLEEVLAGQPLRPAIDLPLVLASLLAFSLAALSLAKGYEILKRNRALSTVLLSERAVPPSRVDHYRIEELNRKMADLVRNRDGLAEENSQLKSQVNSILSELNTLTQVEHMLRKSNIVLSKECERLKSENEALTLKANAPVIKPRRSRIKTKSKARVGSGPKQKRKSKKR